MSEHLVLQAVSVHNMQLRKKFLFGCLHILFPLLLGLALYLCFRPDTYISQLFYQVLGLSPVSVTRLPGWLLAFLQNFACDMLWAYALTCCVYLIWGGRLLPVGLLCVGFSAAMELLQYFGVISGTFDFWDILLQSCATALAALSIKAFFKPKENEK